jgi:hypothetical protein
VIWSSLLAGVGTMSFMRHYASPFPFAPQADRNKTNASTRRKRCGVQYYDVFGLEWLVRWNFLR